MTNLSGNRHSTRRADDDVPARLTASEQQPGASWREQAAGTPAVRRHREGLVRRAVPARRGHHQAADEHGGQEREVEVGLELERGR
jgi:hypothetical protein